MKTTMKFAFACMIVLLAMICSCTRDWKCDLTLTTYGNTHESTVNFRGTKEEAKAYEEQNTFDVDDTGNTVSEMKCR